MAVLSPSTRQQVCDTSSGPSPSTRQHVCDSLHLAPVYPQGSRCVTRFICPQSIHKTAGLCLASSVPSIHMTCFIWPPSLGLLDMGGPASSQATIGIALRVTEALKNLYHFKVVSQQRGKWIYLNTIPQLIKSYNSGQLRQTGLFNNCNKKKLYSSQTYVHTVQHPG